MYIFDTIGILRLELILFEILNSESEYKPLPVESFYFNSLVNFISQE